jgi:tetratricopeptide (TPR) repeat protein
VSAGGKSDTRVDVVWTLAIAAATIAAFLPLASNQFVNWDDPYALTGNERLGSPGLVTWAFTTRLMGHFQPLAWLTWSAVNSLAGMTPAAFHLLSLIGHVVNAALVYWLTGRLATKAGVQPAKVRVAAAAAALLFAVHPLRVEPVAWASAFPYVVSLTWLLAATLTYVRYAEGGGNPRAWFAASVGAYAMSLLSRVAAPGFPLVLLVLDVFPLRRARPAWLDKIPFALLAIVFGMLEAGSREAAPLEEIGLGARLTMAAQAPLIYLGRMFVPVGRSPIDPLPISPVLAPLTLASTVLALAALTIVILRVRQRWPALAAAWVAYLVLLAPVVGLTPSGQTATADRYMYLPGVALSMLAGLAIAQVEPRFGGRRTSLAIVAALTLFLGAATWRATGFWHDSITLWTRALEFDSRNDIATFNLAVAYQNANRKPEAIERYEQTLALIPDHDPARRALVDLRADRGLEFVRERRFAAAASDLRFALDARPDDPGLASALAFSLSQINRSAEAAAVLKDAIAKHPENDELAHNLARLLATSPDPGVRDGTLALRLALAVRERTGGRDPRVLDTLAAAYAAAGQPDNARAVRSEAVALARQLGNSALADEIASHEQPAPQ